jgi:predicted nuclease of restriction endonuclease-like RecB superfamily
MILFFGRNHAGGNSSGKLKTPLPVLRPQISVLTSDQSIVEYRLGQAIPDRLMRREHVHYLDHAARMLAVYRSGAGMSRRELHRSISNVLANEPDCPRQRIAAFCKILDDVSEFDADRKGQAAALRLQVFLRAAAMHPLVVEADQIFERTEHEGKRLIASELNRPWNEIDTALYADVVDRQPLIKFDGIASSEALLSRYNLAQLQACLYKAQRMTVHASADFAPIIRYAKLARLLVDTWKSAADAYRIDLSGPASVLHETRRYGVNFARFISALVSCSGWTLRATVMTPWGRTAELRVSHGDGFRSHVASPPAFDSEVEESLAKKWGESRDGWRLIRDAGILQHGQVTFVPDFLLKHDDGREAFLEIVGFWTPEYLETKRKTIARFADRKILLAIPRRTAKTETAGPGFILYKTRISPESVVEMLAASEK